MSDGVTICESCLDPFLSEIKSSYKASCAHNDTTEDDIEYFKEYVFVCLAALCKSVQELDSRTGQ